MKKLPYIIGLLGIMVILLLKLSVGKGSTGYSDKTLYQARANESIYRKSAIFLSAKYGLDEDKVFALLVDDYGLDDADSGRYQVAKALGNKQAIKQKLSAYATKYDIPTDKIASIFLDYDATNRQMDSRGEP